MTSKKTLILNGRNMTSEKAFWDEIQRVFCPNFSNFGRNWDAFIDILRGGYGLYELDEKINVKIINRKFARKTIGKPFSKTVQILQKTENIELLND